MALAVIASLRSEDPWRKVGAAALDQENRVVATGYNGLSAGQKVDSTFWENRDLRRIHAVHAEMNLLSRCVRGEARTVAVTTTPCQACAQLLVAHGVKHVLYGETYDTDNSIGLDVLKFHGVTTDHIPLEDTRRLICTALEKPLTSRPSGVGQPA